MSEGVTLAADWIVPVSAPPFGPGWVRIEEGCIAELGRGAPPVGARNFGRAAILPGFVNAHTHLACHMLKGRPVSGTFGEWIGESVTPPLMDVLAAEDREPFRTAADHAVTELLRGGVTTVADGFLDDAGRGALAKAGLRGVYFREVFGVSARDEEAYIDETRTLIAHDRSKVEGDVRYGLAPHAPYTCPHRTMQAMARIASDEDLLLSIHVAESPEEDAFFRHDAGPFRERFGRTEPERFRRGQSAVRAVDESGALGANTLVVHAVQVDDEDVDLMAERGASVVHCPGSNFRLGVGVAPIVPMLERGLRVALGTDSGASNGTLDMFAEMRAAAQGQALFAQRAGALEASTLLRMATQNGAAALRLADQVGALDLGLQADLQVVRLDQPRHQPMVDVQEALVFASTPDDVVAVFVGGRSLAGEAS